MANTVKMKQSSVAGKAPTTTDLSLGELAVNTTDGKLYLKKNVSGTESIVEVGAGGVNSVNGQTGDVTLTTGAVVGTTDSQTLSNKTLTGLKETKTAPSISSNTLTLDCSAGNVFAVALNANITTLTFTNVPTTGTAYALTLNFTADGTARTVTWGASVKWPGGMAPTLTSINAKVDTFILTTWDGGTTWYAFIGGQNS